MSDGGNCRQSYEVLESSDGGLNDSPVWRVQCEIRLDDSKVKEAGTRVAAPNANTPSSSRTTVRADEPDFDSF